MLTETETTALLLLDLDEARELRSRKHPAPHQADSLKDLHQWFASYAESTNAGGLVVLPTGGGKTFVAIRFLCAGPLSRGYKVLWLAHTHHLLDQVSKTFRTGADGAEAGHIQHPRAGLRVRLVSGALAHDRVASIQAKDDVVIGSLQTIANAQEDPQQAGFRDFLASSHGKLVVVFDEAHHAPAPTYYRLIKSLRASYPQMLLLGLTATPIYHNESKRGCLKVLFPQEVITQQTTNRLIASGVLAKPVIEEQRTQFTPSFSQKAYERWCGTFRDLPPEIIEQMAWDQNRNEMIVRTYLKNQARYGKTLIFADRWFQCEVLCELLRKNGVKAGAVYSKTDASLGSPELRNQRNSGENQRVLEEFRNNELQVLVNVRMLTEGTDIPDLQTVFLTRQTTSQTLMTQMVGRVLRGPKFGGTAEGYIVPFIDDWRQLIRWAGFEGLETGSADEEMAEFGKRPPLQLISIALVQRLARQMDTGRNISIEPFLRTLPAGWYRVDYTAGVEDETEQVRELVMVYESEVDSRQRLITHLRSPSIDLSAFEAVDVTFAELREWIQPIAAAFLDTAPSADDELNAYHLARHIAQNGESPQYFPFVQRDAHDMDALVAEAIGKDLGPRAIDERLRDEFKRRDCFWESLFPDFLAFKSQFDALINASMYREKHGLSTLAALGVRALPLPDSRLEVSSEMAESVKHRDGYRCLCCGEERRNRLEIDHIVPRNYGGLNTMNNLQTLCKMCNQAKGINRFNFRVNESPMSQAPGAFDFESIPLRANTGEAEEWERYLRRAVNTLYQCAAVKDVLRKSRGTYKLNWVVTLYPGNPPEWINTWKADLETAMNNAREEEGLAPELRVTIQ